MRDTLPQYPLNVECGIVNFNTSNQPGSHLVCYHRTKNKRIYFDSYGQVTPVEIQRYLKTGSEFDRGKEVIQAIGKIPFKPKRGSILPRHRFTGPYNPLHLQLESKDNPNVWK